MGISPDETWLPPSLIQIADYRLELPVPSPADVEAVVLDLRRRRPTESLKDEEAAEVTPRLLRLANRPQGAADGFVVRLRGLIQAVIKKAPREKAGVAPRAVPTLDRLHGMDEAVNWGTALTQDLNAWRQGTVGLEELDVGCLLSGPPGTGKNLFARALAITCDVPLITGSYGDWLGSGDAHQGSLMKAMKNTFATARQAAPCILFLDEIDSFANRGAVRHSYSEWDTQIVNSLLTEIDGVNERVGGVLIGACNHPDRLDPALVRSGRLDRHIRIGLPSNTALLRIFREHLGDDLKGASLGSLGILAMGSTGADCERYVRGARRRARQAGRPMDTNDLVIEIGGPEPLDERTLELMSVHEAGHAVLATITGVGTVEGVTVRRDGAGGGFTSTRIAPGPYNVATTKKRLVYLMGGRAAEEVILGVPSSAAGGPVASDLACATHLALTAVASCGLDEEAGIAWYGPPPDASSPGLQGIDPLLARRVREMLAEAYSEALNFARANYATVHAVAVALQENSALSGDEVIRLLSDSCHELL